jgi:hypothetical protein
VAASQNLEVIKVALHAVLRRAENDILADMNAEFEAALARGELLRLQPAELENVKKAIRKRLRSKL